ncbi:MAG: hypothetical protein OEN56_11540 [Gemmatimonadota bacterium]|nr:hypothetical protein [Gemmatimonadota bacterium]
MLRPLSKILPFLLLALSGCGDDGGGPIGPQETILEGTVFRAGTQLLLMDIPVQMGTETALTTERGRYSFEDPPLGETLISVSTPGYVLFRAVIEIVEGPNDFDIFLIPE